MTARVRNVVEWINANGSVAWAHDLPAESSLVYPNMRPAIAGRVVGPTHEPYWLTSDGRKVKKL